MVIVKKDIELSKALRVREEEILVIEGLAEELNDKFHSDDPRIYGALSGAVGLPDIMINLVFGSSELFNSILQIIKDYEIDEDMEHSQILLTLKEEFRRN